MEAPKAKKYTYEEYLEIDQQSTLKHEFYYGDVYAMTGGTLRHTKIIRNALACLNDHIRKNETCMAHPKAKIEAKSKEVYFVPDLALSCDERDDDDSVFLKYPCLLVEVLSKSTGEFDKTEKLSTYRKIPSLLYYLIVDQYRPHVEVHSKAGDIWRKDVFTNLDEVIYLELLDIKLPVKEIYFRVTFK